MCRWNRYIISVPKVNAHFVLGQRNWVCRCVLLIWILAGNGPTKLAVGAGEGKRLLGYFISRLVYILSFSRSQTDALVYIEIMS